MLPERKPSILLLILLSFMLNASAQWQRTSGPSGISVNVIYRAGNSLFAGTKNKGIYRSTDNGRSWSFSGKGIENTQINDIVYLNGNLLAAVSSSCFGVINIYRSVDNGNTWKPTSGLSGHIVSSFAVKDSSIYAGAFAAQNGVYRSTDNGKTWQAVSSPIEEGDKIFVSGNAIIVSDFNFIWRSINDGHSWQLTEQFALTGIVSFARADATIFAASNSGYYTSTNNGGSWKYNSFEGGAFSLAADTVNNTVFLGSNGKVFKSNNEGATWDDISSHLGFGEIAALLYDGNNLYAATPYDTAGIYASKNYGKKWFSSAAGFPVASTVRSMITLGKYVFAGMQSNGIYRTADNGITWKKTGLNNDTLSHGLVLSFCTKDGLLFAGTTDGIYRSTDSGVTFERKVNGFQTGGQIGIYSLTVSGKNIVAATNISFKTTSLNTIYYSHNNGETWIRGYFPNESVFMSAVASDGSDTVYAGSYGQSFSTTGLYKSYDGGRNWVSKTFSINADIDVLAVQGRHVLAGNLFSAFYSPDGGENWAGSSPPGGGIFTYTIKNNLVFAGNQEGMFYSTDFGASWIDLNQGLISCPTLDVEASCANNNFLFAGTYLDAAWRLPKPSPDVETIISDAVKNAAGMYTLSQNYPNPFTSATRIDYTISKPGMISLKIYNAHGTAMANLVNEVKQAGSYSINFDASKINLAPGVYYYELKTENFVQSKKMILVK